MKFHCSLSALVIALHLLSSAALAQVGYPPEQSPYRDQRLGQTLTVFAGGLRLKQDPANVAPESGALFGLRYDIGIGGPAVAYVRWSGSSSERNEIVPTRPAATRIDGQLPVFTQVADLGIEISLTGRKSWHSMMPSIAGGIGIVTDLKDADAGGYRFGTKFAVSYGAALRVVPGGRLSYRFDVTNYTWQYGYPDSYFFRAADETSVLTDSRQRSSWRWNLAATAGVSISLFK